MSNDQWDNENEGNEQQQTGKGLRAQLEAALAENKKLADQLAKAQDQARQATVSQVLAAKGVSPKVAKLLPTDVEPTAEAIEKWLGDYEDLFAVRKPEDAQTPETQQQTETEELDPAEAVFAEMMQKMGQATNSGKAPGRDADLLSVLNDKSLTQDKLLELIHAQGGGAGVG